MLFERYRFDSVPAFRLNTVRRKYRKLLVRLICQGDIRLSHSLACPCGSDRLNKVSEKDRFGLPFGSFICMDCGLLLLSPRISDESLAQYYREIYHPLVFGVTKGTVLENLVNEKQGEKIFEFMKDHLHKPKMKVCEFGCAGGYNLSAFHDLAACEGYVCTLYGCEYEENYAASAKEKGISVAIGGTESLSQFGVTFDVIILSHVLEHFGDIEREMRTLRELLSDDGLLYIEVPGLMHLGAYRNDLIDYLVHAHNYNFNLRSLENMLNMSGFAMVKGNESLQSIFQKGDATADRSLSERNYLLVLEYLEKTEREYTGSLSARNIMRRFVRMVAYRFEYLLVLRKMMGSFKSRHAFMR